MTQQTSATTNSAFCVAAELLLYSHKWQRLAFLQATRHGCGKGTEATSNKNVYNKMRQCIKAWDAQSEEKNQNTGLLLLGVSKNAKGTGKF